MLYAKIAKHNQLNDFAFEFCNKVQNTLLNDFLYLKEDSFFLIFNFAKCF
jgi:hypothetical protein